MHEFVLECFVQTGGLLLTVFIVVLAMIFLHHKKTIKIMRKRVS